MVNFALVFERIMEIKGLSSEKELAKTLGISPQDFSNRKKRGTLLPVVVEWAIMEGVNLDWLLKGQGEEPARQPESIADPKIRKVVAIMEKLDETAKADLVKQAEKEELVKQIKGAKGLKPIGEAGLIGLNFLVQLLLPAEVILVAVGYGFMDGPTGRELLSYIPYLWMMAIAAFIVYPVEAIRYLKHRCCTLVRLRSWHLGS